MTRSINSICGSSADTDETTLVEVMRAADSRYVLATVLYEKGEFAEAAEIFTHVLQHSKRGRGENDPGVGHFTLEIADVCLRRCTLTAIKTT